MKINFSGMSLRFQQYPLSLDIGKSISTVGIDIAAVDCAPGGEGFWVDVRFDDDASLANESLSALFSKILPLQEGGGKLFPVDEHGFQSIIVRFSIPHHANNSDVAGQLCHGDSFGLNLSAGTEI